MEADGLRWRWQALGDADPPPHWQEESPGPAVLLEVKDTAVPLPPSRASAGGRLRPLTALSTRPATADEPLGPWAAITTGADDEDEGKMVGECKLCAHTKMCAHCLDTRQPRARPGGGAAASVVRKGRRIIRYVDHQWPVWLRKGWTQVQNSQRFLLSLIVRAQRRLLSAEEQAERRRRRKYRVVIWGAHRSGKTTLLYHWKLGVCIPTVRTYGLLEESFTYDTAHTGQRVSERVRMELVLSEIGQDPNDLCKNQHDPKHYYNDAGSDEDLRVTEECGAGGLSSPSVTEDATTSGYEGWTSIPISQSVDKVVLSRRRTRAERRSRRATGAWKKVQHFLKMICTCQICRQAKSRPTRDYLLRTWIKTVQKADAVIYVIDSSNREGIAEIFDSLSMMAYNGDLQDRGVNVLFLANKQDVCGAMRVEEIERLLDLPSYGLKRAAVIGCSGLTGENLPAVMHWLYEGFTTAQQRGTDNEIEAKRA